MMSEIHIIDSQWRMNNADFLVYDNEHRIYNELYIEFELP